MSFQWFDDFSRYGTGSASRTAMRDGLPYAILSNGSSKGFCIADPDPNATGRAYLIGTGSTRDEDMRIALPTPHAGAMGVLSRFWLQELPASTNNRPALIQFRTITSALLCEMRVELNGSITVQRADGTTIADSIVPLIQPHTWNHIEFKYDSSDGTGEIYINGIKKIDVAGGTTGTVALVCHSPRFSSGSGVVDVYMKDYAIWDDNGTENNDIAGTVLVGRRKPNADVTLGGWLPSTGVVGYSLLAKDAVNDTTYLSADDAPPAPMQYTFETIDPDTTSIRAVMSVGRMRKVDGGDGDVQMSLSPNGTDWDDGADRPISSAFTYWWDISEVSPDTTDPWTPFEFNAVIGQVNRTT